MIGAILAVATFLTSSQDRGMKELIDLLGAPTAEGRDQAYQEIISKWKRWGLEDLDLLGEDHRGDAEVAARAREALARIRLRRALGESLIKTIAGLEAACLSRNEVNLLDALARAEQLAQKNGIEGADMVSLLRWFSERKWSQQINDRIAELQKKGFVADPKLVLPWLKDEDSIRKLSALETLARLRARPLAEHILPLLGDAHPDVRFQAGRTLAILRARDQASKVAELLETSPQRRGLTLELLGDMGAREMARKVSACLTDPHFNTRRTAILSLAKMRARDCSSDLVPLLMDTNPTVRREAVMALGTLEATSEIPKIEALLASKDAGTRAAAAATLAELGQGSETLLPLLKDSDVEVKLQVVGALGRTGNRKFAPAVRALLAEDHLYLRAAVLEALGWLSSPTEADVVVPFVTHEQPILREKAIQALGRSGAVDRRKIILDALKDKDGRVRAAALGALQRIQGPDLQKGVELLLQDPEGLVRERAIALLGTLGARSSLNQLRERIRDTDPRVRRQAAEVIAVFGELEDLPEIVTLLDDPIPWVRARVAPLVGRMGAKWSKGPERERLVYLLRASEKDSEWEVEAGAGIGLILLGEKDRNAQRLLVEEFCRPGLPSETRLTQDLLEALSQIHERDAYTKSCQRHELDGPIDSIDSFERFLKKGNLELLQRSRSRIQGGLPKGCVLSPRDITRLVAFPRAIFVSGEGLSLTSWHEALEEWQRRLK